MNTMMVQRAEKAEMAAADVGPFADYANRDKLDCQQITFVEKKDVFSSLSAASPSSLLCLVVGLSNCI